MIYTQEDYILIKLQAARQFYDDLVDMKEEDECEHFVGKFSRDTKRFFDFFDEHTEEMVDVIYKRSPDMWDVYCTQFTQLLEQKLINGTFELSRIVIMLGFFKSCVKDMENIRKDIRKKEINKTKSKADVIRLMLCEPLRARLAPLSTKGYLRGLPFPKTATDTVIEHIEKLYRNE